MGNLDRAWKHVSRAVSKPFTGANKENLRQLDKLLPQVVHIGPLATSLRFGQFDFTWIRLLTAEQLTAFKGEWEAVLQAEAARSSGGRVMPLNAGTRQGALNSQNSAFWSELQKVKDEYRKKAKDSVAGFFSSLTTYFETKATGLSDAAHRLPLIGYYFTQFDAADFAYEDAHRHGAQNDTERTILAVGGLYRVVKLAYKTGKSLAVTIATAGTALTEVKSVIVNGSKLLNTVGGLAAGIVDRIQGKEADFRRLSARVGLEGDLEALKKKLPIIGQEDHGTLAHQVAAGPRSLRAAAEQTLVDLNELRGKLRHAQWWCTNWEKDISEMERDISRPRLMEDLMQRFGQIGAGESDTLLKPSELLAMTRYQEADRTEAAKRVEELKAKVKNFDWFLTERVRRLDDLLAAYDTRLSISSIQSRIAPGIGFNAPQQLAQAAAGFDRSALRPVIRDHGDDWDAVRTRPRSRAAAPPPPRPAMAGQEPAESLESVVARALAKRRAATAADDAFEDDDVFDFD